MRTFRRICVYCGSNSGREVYVQAAADLGRTLAERGIGVVYGGGRVGLMGVLADSALKAGGEVIGVIPEKLLALEVGHNGLTERFVTDGMHARKLIMAQLSDAFIAMPGGFGTLEELFEVTTWTQLNYQLKPVGVLNVERFFDPLLAHIHHAADEGFIRPLHRELVCQDATIDGLLDKLAHAEIPDLGRWISKP